MPTLAIPMTPDGAIVEVAIGVSLPAQQALTAGSKPIPPPVRARLLVDTGASCSSVVKGLLAPLALMPTGTILMHTASSGATPPSWFQYAVSVTFQGAFPFDLAFPTVAIAECDSLAGPIQGLLGRDILNMAVMTFNPLARILTLSF